MKNLFLYYCSVLIPIPLIIWVFVDYKAYFVHALILYYFYRMFTDGFRLVQLEVIKASEIIKMLIPFYLRSKYFFLLYFGVDKKLT